MFLVKFKFSFEQNFINNLLSYYFIIIWQANNSSDINYDIWKYLEYLEKSEYIDPKYKLLLLRIVI